MRGDRRALGAVAGILAIALVGVAAARSRRSLIRVRWEPPPAEGVAGYRLYTRPLDATYGAPRDVGLPPPDRAGALRAVVPGLKGSRRAARAAPADAADRAES